MVNGYIQVKMSWKDEISAKLGSILSSSLLAELPASGRNCLGASLDHTNEAWWPHTLTENSGKKVHSWRNKLWDHLLQFGPIYLEKFSSGISQDRGMYITLEKSKLLSGKRSLMSRSQGQVVEYYAHGLKMHYDFKMSEQLEKDGSRLKLYLFDGIKSTEKAWGLMGENIFAWSSSNSSDQATACRWYLGFYINIWTFLIKKQYPFKTITNYS